MNSEHCSNENAFSMIQIHFFLSTLLVSLSFQELVLYELKKDIEQTGLCKSVQFDPNFCQCNLLESEPECFFH